MQWNRSRRGVAAVLAMLYLILFGILALGFYAATTTAVQVVQNDTKISQASLAAESGLQFLNYQLSQVKITPGIADADVFANLGIQLRANLAATLNMGSRQVGISGNTISIPAGTSNYISLPGSDGDFRGEITSDGSQIIVKVVGRSSNGSISRALKMKFDRDYRDGLFDFAVASKGQITTSGSSHVIGSPDRKLANFLSADKVSNYPIVIGGKEIGGDVSIVSRTKNVDYQSGSVGGSSSKSDIINNHIKKGVPEPEFPIIDVDMYRKYVKAENGGTMWPAHVAEAVPLPAKSSLDAYAWSPLMQQVIRQGHRSGPVLLAGGSLAEVVALRAGEIWCEQVMHNYPRLLMRQLRGEVVDVLAAELAGQTLQGLSVPGGFIVLAAKKDDGGGTGGGGGGGDNSGGNGHVYRNCYIPAGKNAKFTGKDIIEGVLFVEPGSTVSFAGGVQIRGIIVVGKDPNWDYSDPNNPPPVNTVLDFQGTVDGYGVETLDPKIFGDLPQRTGLFIAGLGASVSFKGNFNTVITGSIIASSVEFQGSAGGSIKGSIIGMDAKHPMAISNSQSSDIVFVSRAKENPPSGVHFSSYFKPDPKTYQEVSTQP